MKEKITHPKGVRISSRWLRPAVAIGKGETHLVVTVDVPRRRGGSVRAPLDVAFVIDRSGSMSGQPLELAKRGVIEAIQLLDDRDTFSVIGYDNDVQRIVWPRGASAANKQDAKRHLREVFTGGSTNLFGGWHHAATTLLEDQIVYSDHPEQFNGTPRRTFKRAILLSDGLANVGETNPARIAEYVARFRQLGMTTSTLGLGDQVDDMLLTGMAEAGGGNYAFAASPTDLPAFFARELGEALQIAASGMQLTLTLPKGVRAELLDPFPVTREGKRLAVWLGDQPAGMTLHLAFAITTRADEFRAFPAIEITGAWKGSRGADREQTVKLDPLMVMSKRDFASMPADSKVHEIVAEKISAHARREAVRLYHEGRGAEARTGLQNARDMTMSAPNAAVLSVELDELSSLNEAAPDFAMRRRVAMNNAHRDARGRER